MITELRTEIENIKKKHEEIIQAKELLNTEIISKLNQQQSYSQEY